VNCPDCGEEIAIFSVPTEFESLVPGTEPAVCLCTHCLGFYPVPEVPDEPPAFDRVSDAFPTDPEAAIPLALLIGLLDNLALYRSEIETLLERVERAGVDPLLALDRLAADPGIETDLDLSGRRRQLEQLL